MASPKTSEELKTVAKKAVDGALARGVKGVRAVTSRSRSVSMTYRQGRPEKVEESVQRGLTLHLYLDGRYTACDTNDLRIEAVDRFLDSSVAMVKVMAEDPYRQMPEPELYEGRQQVDLELFDDQIDTISPAKRHEYVGALEKAAVECAGDKLISAEAFYEDTKGEFYKLHSNGFEGSSSGTQFWSYAEIALQDKGDKRPSGSAVAGTRFSSRLESPEQVARRAGKQVLQKLGARKVDTAVMPMIVENRAVGKLLGYLTRSLSARAIQQKASFLEGQRGARVGSDLLDLHDDPFVPSGFGSRLFDGEGISARKMPIFEKGILKNYYVDTYYGKKLGLNPSCGSSSNLVLTPGQQNLDGLCAQIDKGILVRGFLGGNSNTTTGDFSLGIYGTLIEKGQLAEAVSEMNIAGNLSDLWQRLVAVGNDPYTYSSVLVPSVVFDGVQFAGD